MKSLIIFFSCTLLMFSCKPQASDIPLSDIERHIEYQEIQGVEKVKNEYITLQKNNANSKEAYYLLARCENDDEKILQLINEALNIDPNFYDALIMKANIFNKNGKINKAFQLYRDCIKINSENYEAHLGLANALIKISEDEEALNSKVIYHLNALSEYALALNSINKSKSKEKKYTNLKGLLLGKIKNTKEELDFLEDEIEKKYKCEKISGYYKGDIQMGNTYGVAGLLIKNDCSCEYEYKVILYDRIDGEIEICKLNEFKKFSEHAGIEGTINCNPKGGKYQFNWYNSEIIKIETPSTLVVLSKQDKNEI